MSEKILIPKTTYIYRVMHRIMEGDCQYDHGPRPVCAGPFYADKYPVTNMMYYRYLKESNYEPSDATTTNKQFIINKLWQKMRA